MTTKTRLLTYREVKAEKINLSRAYIWRLEKAGKFPKHRKVGKANYWLESDIDEWLAKLPTKQEQVA
ncbi:helix-turn-helix transcriptional regulator [Thiothrix eikelboomii]|uniref:helix-turn-helix transcriptional regulator n=1 Tax=Thiothrix eikelboomii TaxID=92487 RepID=UPI003BB1DDC7